ncbi:hypothetical protein H8A97_29550 [Bradyrhizobium sp. Arg62]|uniref:hypothetical protein n=1 Tax=Bradyrhizobium brasilense TaxID=1419277 RepID=UPI001E2F9E5B|nr:hypothetical protein [Bradyrhizobium brasilense]MCC8949136.1 hypothetical protein [Bradyrhizobium brasilense]
MFGRQEDVRESFQPALPGADLPDARPHGHARLEDELFLVAETTRLLRAMKKED